MQMKTENKKTFIYKIFKEMKKDEYNFTFNKIYTTAKKYLNNNNNNNKNNENLLDDPANPQNSNKNLSKNLNYFLTKRRKIISLIRDIHYKLNFNKETFYTAVYYFDIICNKLISEESYSFENFDFKNLLISCLIISSKFCDNDPNIPNIKEYLITDRDRKFNRPNDFQDPNREEIRIIKEFEVNALRKLGYKLNYSSPYHYIKFFYCFGFIFKKDFQYFKYILFLSKEKNLEKNEDNEIFQEENLLEDFYFFVEYAYKKCEEIIYLITLDEEFFVLSQKNNKEIEGDLNEKDFLFEIKEFDSLKIACGLIYFCREIFFHKINTEKLIDKSKQKFEIWGKIFQNLFKIKFEDFKDEYYKIKK